METVEPYKNKGGRPAASRILWTINSIWRETGIAPRTIERRLLQANVKPRQGEGDSAGYYGPEVFPVIFEAKNGDKASAAEARRRFLNARADEAERKNRIEEQLANGTLIKADVVEKVLLMGLQRLELIPNKMQSEFGLAPAAMKRLEQLLDEARAEWAKQMGSTEE